MEKEKPHDKVELNQDKEEEEQEGRLDWFLKKESSKISPEPMDSNVLLSR